MVSAVSSARTSPPVIILSMPDRPDENSLGEAARPLPGVAREAIRAQLECRDPQAVVEATGLLTRPAPVFVTLRIAGDLRGCIGSLTPRLENLVEETMDRARAAAFQDPRFSPLTLPELERTDIEVSILGPLEAIASRDDLDPARFGIEVRDGHGRRAVLLPEISGVDTVEQHIELTRQKARIPRGANLEIRRFSVVKVGE